MTNFESLVNPDDVCRYLGIDRSTLYRWVDEGRIRQPIRLGGEGEREVRRWRQSELDADMDSTRPNGASNIQPRPA